MGLRGEKGVVSAGHQLTAEAGAEMLRCGGNAIDAAIAAIAMAFVCEPVLASPGGGGFAMVRTRESGRLDLIDFFAHTPKQRYGPAVAPSTPPSEPHRAGTDERGVREIVTDFGTAVQGFRIGPATAATPGVPAGLAALHGLGATLPMADSFRPARATALNGVTITPFQERLFKIVEPILTATESARRLFAPSGRLPITGDVMRNPGLADVLDALAPGDGSWIDGPVGKAMRENQHDDGHVRRRDLFEYEVETREPLTISLGDAIVHLNPLPAAGGLLVAHSLRHLSSNRPSDFAKAFHRTARDRAEAGGDLAVLETRTIRRKGTTHISVIDADSNVCAVTVSNGEGNGEVVAPYGFMLNNILGEDDVNPAGTIAWPVDTRLSSMMCPTIIERADGGLLALGSGGSNRIRTAMAQVIARCCVDGIPTADAVEAPRIHVEGDHLDFEDFFSPDVTDELTGLWPDHLAWPERHMFFGGVNVAARLAGGGFDGAGDPRRSGHTIFVD